MIQYLTSILVIATILNHANGLTYEERLKASGNSIFRSTIRIDEIIDQVPFEDSDANEMERYDRIRTKDVQNEIMKVFAKQLDKIAPDSNHIDRRYVALNFRLILGQPCELIIKKLGDDHARILRAGTFSGDQIAARYFLKVDICQKIILDQESIIDKLCESLLCTDSTLIQIKQLTRTSNQAYEAILNELRQVNQNLMRLTVSPPVTS